MLRAQLGHSPWLIEASSDDLPGCIVGQLFNLAALVNAPKNFFAFKTAKVFWEGIGQSCFSGTWGMFEAAQEWGVA